MKEQEVKRLKQVLYPLHFLLKTKEQFKEYLQLSDVNYDILAKCIENIH